MSKIGIVGYGWVGKAYHKLFPEAIIYDEPLEYLKDGKMEWLMNNGHAGFPSCTIQYGREAINSCDLVLIAVPTNLKDGSLDMSIVEDVVNWIKPLMIIKSALMPGTTDYLVKKYKKRISVSVEMVGEGSYFIPFWKYPHPEDPSYHQFLIVGGEEKTATEAANYLWEKMSPSTDVHIISAVEAEICKLMENFWGALKVTFANEMFELCRQYGANYTKVLQAWGSDGRTEKMHMRVTPNKRGWKSKCWDKDIPALQSCFKDARYKSPLVEAVLKCNSEHLKK